MFDALRGFVTGYDGGGSPSGGGGSCGNSCSSPAQRACDPPPISGWTRRGNIPVISPICRDDVVTQYGRVSTMNVPEYIATSHVSRAATYSPADPLSASGQKAAGTLNLPFVLSAAAPATAQGQRFLFAGMVLEIATSDNVSPGVSDCSLAGTFEDGQPFAHTFQVSCGTSGLSRFIVFFTRVVQGGSYPCLVEVSRDFQLTLPAISIPLTAAAAPNDATAFVPTNGIRSAQRDFNVNITNGVQGTNYRAELLTPAGQFWYWAEAVMAAAMVGGGHP